MTPVAALDLYSRSLDGQESELVLRAADGSSGPLPVSLWLGPLTLADRDVLTRAHGPVLDIGCGPGRHVIALAQRGMLALGVDVCPAAARVARGRGADVLEASVFDRIPGAGTWRTALLLDGNIGIGGDPAELLGRIRALMGPNGTVLVELEAPGARTSCAPVRLEGSTSVSGWFRWAKVSVDDIKALGLEAGFGIEEIWEEESRWFARLTAP